MKAFQMNEIETVFAETKEQAIEFLYNIMGYNSREEFNADFPDHGYPEEVEDLDNNFLYYSGEDDLGPEEAVKNPEKYKMSYRQFIERHSKDCPQHFATEW